MRRLIALLFLLTLTPLAFSQGGTATPVRTGTALPSSAPVSAIFIINDGSGAIYVCTHAPTCTTANQWVSVSTGVAPSATLVITPNQLLFGSGKVGTATDPQSISIANSGNVAVAVSNVTFGGAQFSEVTPNICDVTIKPGGVCVDDIQFTAASTGAKTDTLTVISNAPVDPLNPLTVALSGTGVAGTTYQLSLTGFGNGSGTVSDGASLSCHFTAGTPDLGNVCLFNYAASSSVTLTATADAGSTFSTFTGASCTTSPCSITMSSAFSVSSTFTLNAVTNVLSISCVGQGTGTVVSDVNDVITGNPINATCTAGAISGTKTGTFNQNTVVTLTETPSSGCTGGACTFTTWGGATSCTTTSTCAITLGSNANVSASFALAASGAPLQLIQTVGGGTGGTNNVAGTWANAIGAGDVLVVYGLWNDATTTVTSVTDTKGNTYTQFPVCSPKTATGLTEVAYYAQNVVAAAAGANVTTIALSAQPATRQLFGLHYSGVTATPFDVCAGNSGTGTAVSSGNLTTSVTGDVITAAAVVANHITVVGSGFTQRISASGNDAEDQQGVATGTYANAPTNSNSSAWVDIAGAFKASGSGAGTTYNFNVLCSGAGTGTVVTSGISVTCANSVPTGTSSTTVASGTSLQVVATPANGSGFTTYTGLGCSTNPTCLTTPITAPNASVTATFALAGVLNYYVATTGNDTTGTGSQAAPWATITKASTAATLGANGTIINVAAGTYAGCITTSRSGTVNARFQYLGASSYGSIIQATCSGTNQWVWWNKGDYSDITGFAITGTQNGICIGLDVDGSFSSARGNKIGPIPAISASCNNGGGGIVHTHRGSVAANGHDDTDDRNLIDSVGLANGSCPNMHGIYGSISRLTLTNNIVSRACGWGVQFYHYTTQEVVANNVLIGNLRGCMIITASDGGVIMNNTSVINNVCANNSGEGGIEERYGNATGTSMVYRNNRFWGNTPTTGCSNPPTGFALCEYNFTYGPRTVSGPLTVGTNAQFTNYTGNAFTGTYTPASSSSLLVDSGATGPCAAGGITPCVSSIDIVNVTRPQRTAFDQGAYELP